MLLIAGAGFDPRSMAVAARLGSDRGNDSSVFFKETGRPAQDQADRASANMALDLGVCAAQRCARGYLRPNNAVIGGSNIVTLLDGQNFEDVTDLVADLTLSAGTASPSSDTSSSGSNGERGVRTFTCSSPMIQHWTLRSSRFPATHRAISTVSGVGRRWMVLRRPPNCGCRN